MSHTLKCGATFSFFATHPAVLQPWAVRLRTVTSTLVSMASIVDGGYDERLQEYKQKIMNLSHNIGPVASLIAGILILLMPRLLNYIVAIYLIIIGLIGLFGSGSLRF